MSREVTWEPVTIDLEWGKLSGKISIIGKIVPKLKILGVHGWLDNANTYDTLAPYLPSGTELLVLDLPGHGFSDHLPVGAHYDVLTYVLNLKRAVDKYGWDKFILLGHSLGACICNIFTSLFPENVIGLVSLDSLVIRSTSIEAIKQSFSSFFKGEKLKKQKALVYSEEEAVEKLLNARGHLGVQGGIDRDAAYILLPRSAKQVENGYMWTHDPRARANFLALFGNSLHKHVECIKCPVLLITANQGIFTQALVEFFKGTIDVYKSNAKLCEVVSVDGPHHVHLTHPERIAKPLVAFIDRVVKEDGTVPLARL